MLIEEQAFKGCPSLTILLDVGYHLMSPYHYRTPSSTSHNAGGGSSTTTEWHSEFLTSIGLSKTNQQTCLFHFFRHNAHALLTYSP